jgi:ArsR family transcriptional regulator, arsenate/arsenite/antimonite-responsive transcriptional repressor
MHSAELFRCLGEGTRWRMVRLLRRGPLCVCHLQDVLGLPQATVSKRLADLRAFGLVSAVRRGQWMIYQIAEGLPPSVEAVLLAADDPAGWSPEEREDLRRLEEISEFRCQARELLGGDIPNAEYNESFPSGLASLETRLL